MTAPSFELPPVIAFCSYAHKDDEAFGMVDPICQSLSTIFQAQNGRALQIFVDRESIGWGAEWRREIALGVSNAQFFLPIFTANYLASTPCREELLAFYASAKELGVTELILPLALFGENQLRSDSPDEVARLLESLQYKPIRNEWQAGPDSPEWRRKFVKLADELAEANLQAEARILEIQNSASADSKAAGSLESPKSNGDSKIVETTEETLGLVDLTRELNDEFEMMTPLSESIAEAVASLGKIASESTALMKEGDSPKVRQNKLSLVAKRFEGPAKTIERDGRALNEHVVNADSHLRTMLRVAKESNVSGFDQAAREGAALIIDALGGMSGAQDSTAGLLESFRGPETLSVSIRRALAPARVGLNNLSDALRTLDAWENILQS